MDAVPLFWTDEALDFGFAATITADFEVLYACVQCGSCTASCPTANRMSLTPQRLSRMIRLGLKDEVLKSRSFWLCTSCGACATQCPRGISMLDLMIGLKRYAIGHDLEVPDEVRLLSETVHVSHNISGDLNEDRLGWSKNLPQPLTNIEGRTGAEVAFFVGCVSSFYPRAYSIPQAFGRLLHLAGVEFTTLGSDEWCCGYPLFNAGVDTDLPALIAHNVDKVKAVGAHTVVTTCPSCYYAWKVLYPRFGAFPRDLAVVHASELLADLLESRRLRPAAMPRRVTYHDPCDLARKGGEYDAPRRVLQSLPGVELREMANIRENALCCGGGGDVKIYSHDTTMDVARRRVQQALDIEADTIVSACQQCKRALLSAVQAMRQPVRVLDVTELVWESMHDRVEW